MINIANTQNTKISFSKIVIKTFCTVQPASPSSMRLVLPGVNDPTLISKSGLVISVLAPTILGQVKNRVPSEIIRRKSPMIFLITVPSNEVVKKIITIIS